MTDSSGHRTPNGSSRNHLILAARAAARVVAVSRIDAVRAALEQFEAGSADGLHDVRVALRRLRSWMRAYRPQLDDTVRKKTRRRIEKLARITDDARDAQVMVAWIAAQHDVVPRARRGISYIADRITQECDQAVDKARATLTAQLPDTLDTLEKQLGHYWRRVGIERQRDEEKMASVTADVVRQQYRRFRRRRARVDSVEDDPTLHRARIAAKRLRYLLEYVQQFPGVAGAVGQLAELQDLLGRCHDDHVLITRVFDEIASAGAADASRRAKLALELEPDDDSSVALARIRPGLLELASRARRERDETFRRFEEVSTPAAIDEMSRVVDGVVTELELL